MNPTINFQPIKSVNKPSSMHGIYPYRGKISSVDAEMIISQLPKTGALLDPFCGSGTIVYEAQKHGLKAYGIDNNPLAVQLAKAKIFRPTTDVIKECEELIQKAKNDLLSQRFDKMPITPAQLFHEDTANEIMTVKAYFNEMNDFLKGAYLGTIALAARGCNGYIWTSSSVGKNIEPKQYISFYDKFISKVKKHAKYFNLKNTPEATIIKGDSRELSSYIAPHSIDYVFTSPPYFDALDYTAYYGKIIYDIFETDRNEIKKQLIQCVNSYREDMEKVIKELEIITTENALIIFVVGDKKLKGQIINGGEFFSEIKKASYIVERSYSDTSSKVFDAINKTDRKEQIVVWDRSEK